MFSSKQGYLLMAVGKRRFLEMAVDLVLSLRQFDDRPVALATDAPIGQQAREDFAGIFSSIHPIEPEFMHHRALKFSAARVTPFEETVYLDVDCLILANPEPLWTGAGPGPITMTGEILTRDSRDRRHQGFSTREIMERFDLETYLKSNGGVLHFRREGAGELLQECHACYNEVVLGQLWDGKRPSIGLGDEFAFGIVGGRRRFDTYSSPVPTHWTHQVRDLDLDRIEKPVLHFTAPIPRKALDVLMQDVARRRRAAGLPPTPSIAEWRREGRGPGLVQHAKRLIYRKVLRHIRRNRV